MAGYYPQQYNPYGGFSMGGGGQQSYNLPTGGDAYYGGQQQGYGNAWPGMTQGYGGGGYGQGYYPGQSQGYSGAYNPYQPQPGSFGQQQYGQYQPSQGYQPQNTGVNGGAAAQQLGAWMQANGQDPMAPQQTQQQSDLGARRGRLSNKLQNLQAQYGGASTQNQAGIQSQINAVQGRLQNVRGQVQDQRQAARQAANAPPGAQAPAQPGVPNAADPGLNKMFSNFYLPSNFNTQFGNLVEASGGNSNLYKRNQGGDDTLYNYDPTKGWQQFSGQQYRGMSDQQTQGFADPNQYAKQAGGIQGYGGTLR